MMESENNTATRGETGESGAAEHSTDEELFSEETGDSRVDSRDEIFIKGLFEAVLFMSNEPLSVSFFVKNFSIDPTQARIMLDSLLDEYEERDGGIQMIEVSNGFQFVTRARYADQIRRALGFRKKDRLTKSMLETLSIMVYKQPITMAEIDELRGVSSRMMVAGLMKRNLVKPVGRKNMPGRPLLYGTTDEFLRYFGLNRISDLPKLSEIKEFSITGDGGDV